MHKNVNNEKKHIGIIRNRKIFSYDGGQFTFESIFDARGYAKVLWEGGTNAGHFDRLNDRMGGCAVTSEGW